MFTKLGDPSAYIIKIAIIVGETNKIAFKAKTIVNALLTIVSDRQIIIDGTMYGIDALLFVIGHAHRVFFVMGLVLVMLPATINVLPPVIFV